jgi:hypothetical protein
MIHIRHRYSHMNYRSNRLTPSSQRKAIEFWGGDTTIIFPFNHHCFVVSSFLLLKKPPFLIGSTLVYPTNLHEIPLEKSPSLLVKKSPTKPTFPWKSSFNQFNHHFSLVKHFFIGQIQTFLANHYPLVI